MTASRCAKRALFVFLGQIPHPLNYAKIHARGGGGLQPEVCRDLTTPPQAQTSPEQSAKAVRGGRDRAAGGARAAAHLLPGRGAGRRARAGGGVLARGLPARGGGRRGLGGAGTVARRGRCGGRFAGAGQTGGGGAWRRDGRLSGRDAGNWAAGARLGGGAGSFRRGAAGAGRGGRQTGGRGAAAGRRGGNCWRRLSRRRV